MARYDGEGIVCWLDDPQHGGEYDASLPYEAVQNALTGCLPGWKYEETSKAKVHSDRAFIPVEDRGARRGQERAARPSLPVHATPARPRRAANENRPDRGVRRAPGSERRWRYALSRRPTLQQ